jgi:hypothetical protein
VNPGTDKPKIDVVDPILPSAGALFLTETMHPVQPWASGVPSVVPNVAAAQAQALLGSPYTEAAINQSWTDGTYGGPNYGLAERSGKGGLATIFTGRDSTTIEVSKGLWSSVPSIFNTYLLGASADGHGIYVSMWSKTTRVGPSSGQANWHFSYGQAVSVTGKFQWAGGAGDTVRTSGGSNFNLLGSIDTASGSALGNRRRSIATSRNAGVTFSGGGQGYFFNFGTHGTANSYLNAKSRAGANIFYRTYMEDLAVSGRTYAEVDAIDAAMFAQAFGVGGRYYNDNTYTDPATIP